MSTQIELEQAMPDEIADYEAQLDAMRKVMEAIRPLKKDAQVAVLDWVDTQLGRSRSSNRAGSESSRKQAANGGDSPPPERRPGTVSTVAQKLGANSARLLLLAAAAYLSIYQGKDSFTRGELVACAKEARGWKVEYSNQMALNITRMLDSGILFEKSRDVFSLSDVTLKEMEGKLA
jgi:hypothetical protein